MLVWLQNSHPRMNDSWRERTRRRYESTSCSVGMSSTRVLKSHTQTEAATRRRPCMLTGTRDEKCHTLLPSTFSPSWRLFIPRVVGTRRSCLAWSFDHFPTFSYIASAIPTIYIVLQAFLIAIRSPLLLITVQTYRTRYL
jgi:hypothetical protein